MKKFIAGVLLAAITILPSAIITNNVAFASTEDSHEDSSHMVETELETDSHVETKTKTDAAHTTGTDAHADDSHATGSDEEHSESGGAHHFGIVFAMFALVLVVGKLGNFVEKFGQPAVIGELLAGIALSAAGYFGWGFIGDIAGNQIINFLAQFGALILLFSIGLESNLKEMQKVGTRALIVALIGVILPFVAGSLILGPIFFGDASSNARLFLGASLVATSVGITASVCRSLKLTKSRAIQTVLGAAVIDDVLGLIVLAIVSSLASGGELTAGLVAGLALKSFGFLAGAIVLGTFTAKPISQLFSKINDGIGMKLSLAIGFALLFGYLAELFGLEPIIGAFAAGLLLDAVHFERFTDPSIVKDIKHLKDDEVVAAVIKKHRHGHVEDLVNGMGLIFVPVFFVLTGVSVDFGSLLNPKLYLIAGAISVVAVATKWVAGLAASGTKTEKMLVGVSMVPRGEVGLIFAATGAATLTTEGVPVLSSDMFSTIVLVVIMTTFVGPFLIKKYGAALKAEEKEARAQKKEMEEKAAAKEAKKTVKAKTTKKTTKKTKK